MRGKIFVACHKKCDVPSDEVYLPVFVGAHGKPDNGFQRDDVGENISIKNALYCELTGLYWCWKNTKYDFLGLSHYRRFFTLKTKREQKMQGLLQSVISLEECEKLLSNYRVIVPRKRNYYIETVYNHYNHTFDGKQLDLARDILSERHPEQIVEFDDLMKGKKAYVFNMFIMGWDLVDDYCSWLFPILNELEKRYDTTGMTAFEKRYIGRVAERLFNVWLNSKVKTGELKPQDIREIPYTYFGEVNWPKKIIRFLLAKFFHLKYEQSF